MTTIAAETTKPEPLGYRERADAIARIVRALIDISPSEIPMDVVKGIAHDVARDTIDSFLIELEGRR